MVISSRTPEGDPGLCPICGEVIKIEPSKPTRDAPCPCCGHLNWLGGSSDIVRVVPSACTLLGPDQIQNLLETPDDHARDIKRLFRDLHPQLRQVFPEIDSDPVFRIEA
jgi:hypothetical protein